MAAAVDVDTDAVHVARIIGRQEGDDGRYLFRLGGGATECRPDSLLLVGRSPPLA
jgi:hypothetical protein